MGIPNPIDVAKATAEVFLGPQVAMAQAGVHITKATATHTVDTLDNIPANVTSFITFPLRMLQHTMNVGFWVLDHLGTIFFIGLALLLLLLARLLLTGFKAVEGRITDTVKGKPRPQRHPHPGDGRQASHPQNVVQPDGMLCVRGGVVEARHIARRQGASAKTFSRGRCGIHNGSHLYEVV